MSSRTVRKYLPWFSLLLLIPSVVLNLFLFQKSQKEVTGIKVIEVLDGDTLLLEGDVRLRLRQVDAPELQFCGGEEAKNYLTSLLKGKKVLIKEERLDQYGRPMALVYLGNDLINLDILKTGLVRYHSDSTSQTEVLKGVSNKAKNDKLGIYSSECWQTENTQNPKCNIKGNIDKNGTSRKYYFPGCPQYNFTIVEKDLGEDWFCTADDAIKAGFTKAQNCP